MKLKYLLLFASLTVACAQTQSDVERAMTTVPPGATDLVPRTPVAEETLTLAESQLESFTSDFSAPLTTTNAPEFTGSMSGLISAANTPIESPAPAQSPAPEPAPAHRFTLEQIRYADTLSKEPEYVFILGNFAFRSLADLKRGVSRLPKGSQITWSPTCLRLGGEPLDVPGALDELAAHCKAVGAVLVVIPSG